MKTVALQWGNQTLEFEVSDSSDVLSLPKDTPLKNPVEEIYRSLRNPHGTESLESLAKGRKCAAIVVSDNTRPVPYKEPNGILSPLIRVLQDNGVARIKILVANGTHHALDKMKLENLLGAAAFQAGIEIINHVATDESMLRSIGRTQRTPDVTINRHYLDADLKIATGLVEPHFMAGFSGGRKAICPGICGVKVTHGFHSASMHEDERAASMILEGNPCHEESLRIAKMAGVDFIVNVTIDHAKQITGVFAGALEDAHQAAVRHIHRFSEIPIGQLYDIVITQAGYVGINHYQCAKAAVEAAKAVKVGGSIVLLADLTDNDPLGGKNYKALLAILAQEGHKAFKRRILASDWSFVPEQWQVQMWGKVFDKLGSSKNFHICAPQLTDYSDDCLSETNVAAINKRAAKETDAAYMQRIVQECVTKLTTQRPNSRILILPDGPYAVPVQAHLA